MRCEFTTDLPAELSWVPELHSHLALMFLQSYFEIGSAIYRSGYES
jgi:hypothetical protein